jgi:hypothetical protein
VVNRLAVLTPFTHDSMVVAVGYRCCGGGLRVVIVIGGPPLLYLSRQPSGQYWGSSLTHALPQRSDTPRHALTDRAAHAPTRAEDLLHVHNNAHNTNLDVPVGTFREWTGKRILPP